MEDELRAMEEFGHSSTPTIGKQAVTAAKPAAKPAAAAVVKGPETPKCTVVHSGSFDLSHYTNTRDAPPARPQQLIVRVELPRVVRWSPFSVLLFLHVCLPRSCHCLLRLLCHHLMISCSRYAQESVAELDLEITARKLELVAGQLYRLDLTLPFPVVDEKGTAKFDKTSRVLTVTLPVEPPPKPEPVVFTPTPDEEEESETAGKQRLHLLRRPLRLLLLLLQLCRRQLDREHPQRQRRRRTKQRPLAGVRRRRNRSLSCLRRHQTRKRRARQRASKRLRLLRRP